MLARASLISPISTDRKLLSARQDYSMHDFKGKGLNKKEILKNMKLPKQLTTDSQLILLGIPTKSVRTWRALVDCQSLSWTPWIPNIWKSLSGSHTMLPT